MIKKLLMKIVGSKLKETLKLDQPVTMPAAGAELVSVPWYRSKAKLGFGLYLVVVVLEYGPPAFGKPAIHLPKEWLDLLEGLGLGLGGYGLRDAMKKPA